MAAVKRPTVALLLIISTLIGSARSAQYFGKFLGKLTELHHGVSGEVYAVDGKTLHIKDFTYDGQGPAAYFYAGNSRSPSNAGFRIPDENGNPGVIRRYRKEGVTITLPEGKTLNNIKWFSIWCEEFEVNFGDVKIPRNFDFPRPQKIDPMKGVHGISSDNIVIVDAQTLLIPNLSYDGEAPDAKFWVGRGAKPTPQGIRVPDENGKEIPLRRYDRKTIVLTLPGDLTVFDIGHFGIWCEAFTVDFGHVLIPQNLNVPPSLKMLGVSPQSKLNCEVLHDDLAFEVRWAVAGDSIVFQLVAKLDDREYMSFGLSGDDHQTKMVGGDVVVAWVDKDTSKGYAEDYFLDAKSQCSGPKGSCPDTKLARDAQRDNIRLLNAATVNGYSIITYQRPLRSSDDYDKTIPVNKSQAIIWAIGPLNERNEVSFHTHYLKDDQILNFGRPPKWNCPTPQNEQPPMKPIPTKAYIDGITQESSPPTRTRTQERRRGESRRGSQNKQESVPDSEKSATRTRQQTDRRGTTNRNQETTRTVPTPAPVKNRNAWEIPPIQCHEPEDGVFYAQMGPTGGKRGYPAITGHVGWGISWYINGLLIPEINVVRGKTYTFVVEGGFDPDVPAKYHPFYITDDPIGGYEYKTPEERKNVHIYAGAKKGKDGAYAPTGVGRLCHWTHQGDSDADDFESFGAYQRTLELKCDQGEPGVIQWTPDHKTPDVVYYQCFTHRYLGWKINVLDECDTAPAASEPKPSVVLPDPGFTDKNEEFESRAEDLESSPSIQVATIVKPNDIPNYDKSTDKAETEYTTDAKFDGVSAQTEPVRMEPQIAPVSVQTEESFLVPQPNFFDQSYFLSQTQMFPASHYNPYASYQYPYQNQYQQSFRPSQFIDGLFADQTKFEITKPEPLKESSTTSTTTTTTTTTTSTTTEASVPLVSSTNKPVEVKKVNPPSIRPQLPNVHNNGVVFRRPMFPPKFTRQPPLMVTPHKNVMRIPMYSVRPSASNVSFKKVLYRPPSMLPPRPNSAHVNPKHPPKGHEIKPIVLSNVKTQLRPHPPNIIIMKPQQVEMKSSPSHIYVSQPNIEFDHIPTRAELEKHPLGRPLLEIDRSNSPPQPKPQKLEKLPNSNPVENPQMKVEISPQQPSTERNPETQTPKQFAPVISVKKTDETPPIKMRPAVNTGFHPETVVVEGGFKPIISQEIQKRHDEVEYPPIEYASEIGVINVKKREQEQIDSQQDVESFEPVFVPSPLDKQQVDKILKLHKRRPHHQKKTTILLVIKQPRDLKMVDDVIAEAAERVDSYYLPPPGGNKNKPAETPRQPSNIDFPPGVVITFDGKRVSGQSLTAKSNGGSVLEGRSSKAAELLKASKPQTVIFKGDLPPLDKVYINPNAPQLQQQGSISRELGAPSGTTKLSLVRQRRRREAHHTPEHTAQQQKEKEEKAKNSTGYTRGSFLTTLSFCAITYLINYLKQ